VIVGSSLKVDGRCENPVDVERVRRLVAAARARSADRDGAAATTSITGVDPEARR
jgi:hypothetical protein